MVPGSQLWNSKPQLTHFGDRHPIFSPKLPYICRSNILEVWGLARRDWSVRPVGMYAGTAALARRSHDLLTMQMAAGATVKVKVSDLADTDKRKYVWMCLDTASGACYVTGVVVGRAGAWTHTRFSDAHPEIPGNASLKAGSLQSQGRAPGSGGPGAPLSQPDPWNTDALRDAELEEDEDVDDAEEADLGEPPRLLARTVGQSIPS